MKNSISDVRARFTSPLAEEKTHVINFHSRHLGDF
jgi:hypothetical protein